MLYCDSRLGGVGRLSTGPPEDWKMRIPDDVLKCVCFLCVRKPTPEGEVYSYGGTAFFVVLPNEVDSAYSHIYMVTARHCVDMAAKFGPLFLRLNAVTGGAGMVLINSEWVMSENPSVDVAVLPFAPPQDRYDYKFFAQDILLTDEKIAEHGVGPGDNLVVTGLFTERSGKERNFPIVRSGIIAAMPGEPLVDEDTGLEYPAYIAEVRSIGGLSGSPVLVSLEPGRVHPGTNKIVLERRMFLLGIIRGHWDYAKKKVFAFSDDELKAVNMGMALVTPISELSKILSGEKLMRARRDYALSRARETAPTKDAVFEPAEDPSAPFTKDDFMDALKRVSRKQPDAEKSET